MARPWCDEEVRAVYQRPYIDKSGQKLCRWRPCSKILTGRQQHWCSPEHGNAAYATYAYPAARQLVFNRDQGICAHCGLDCEHVKFILDNWYWNRTYHFTKQKAFGAGLKADAAIREVNIAIGLPMNREPHADVWEADHIVALAEGGKLCDIDNLRTLCYWCHKKETKALAGRRAAARRAGLASPD